MKTAHVFAVLIVSFFCLGSLAQADPIQPAYAVEGYGTFSGSFSYSFNSATSARLVVQLTNTSTLGGYITAFAFNNPNADITGATLSVNGNSNFSLFGSTAAAGTISDTAPFGSYDLGASTSSSFNGGGNPTGGISVLEGQVTFTFNLTGNNLNTLNTLTFVNDTSGSGQNAGFLAIRFKGFLNGGSDKVLASDIGVSPVPEPYSASLVGLGALALMAGRFRKRTR